MGTWGTAIQSNDTFADIYYLFFDQFNKGVDVKIISANLIRDNQDIIQEEDDAYNFWFALAKAQWEVGELDPFILAKTKDIISKGKDIDAWKRLGADQKKIESRKARTGQFLTLLQSENKKPKKRKKPVKQIFRKGECLAIKIKRNHSEITYYTGAIVLELDGEVNLVAKISLQKLSLPTLEDFLPYHEKLNNWNVDNNRFGGNYRIGVPAWYLLRTFRKFKDTFTSVGVLDISTDFGSSEETESRYGINPDWMDIPFRRW
jgi:hypothetical protein